MKKEMKNPIADEKKDARNRISERVSRGSSWRFDAQNMRVSIRLDVEPMDTDETQDFRVVRNKK